MFYLKSIKILILGIFVLFQFGSHAEAVSYTHLTLPTTPYV